MHDSDVQIQPVLFAGFVSLTVFYLPPPVCGATLNVFPPPLKQTQLTG